MTGPASSVRPASLRDTLLDHNERIRSVEAPSPGQWVYVLPVAPAPVPPDQVPSDPLSPPFVNGWANVALPDGTYSPLRFRIHPATKVELVGAIGGGLVGTVCTTLPLYFRPRKDEVVTIASTDGSQAMTMGVSASTGEVRVIAIVSGAGGGGTIVAAGGIIYDFVNSGDWLYVKATGLGGPLNVGIGFESDQSITLQANTAPYNTIELDARGGSIIGNANDGILDGFISFNSGTLGVTDINGGGAALSLYSQFFQVAASGGMEFDSFAGGIYMYNTASSILLSPSGTGDVEVVGTGTAGCFYVYDNGAAVAYPGIELQSLANEIYISNYFATGKKVNLEAGGALYLFAANGALDIGSDSGAVTVWGAEVDIVSDGLGLLGFFGVAAVAQQATPVTLGDVIALLQAYGLSA